MFAIWVPFVSLMIDGIAIEGAQFVCLPVGSQYTHTV